MKKLIIVIIALTTAIATIAAENNLFPNARLAYVTPWAVDRPGFTEVNAQIIKACGQRGIPVLDMAALGVIDVNNPEFRARYFQGPNDTAHLNAEGHDLLVPLGEAFIRLIGMK